MKKWTKWIALALIVFMATAGLAMAANGASAKKGAQAKASNKGLPNLPCLLILNGDPVTVAGTVYAAPYDGQGITVDTGTELVTVYGLGPQWYWDLLGIEKPDVGETVEISAVSIIFSDKVEKIIAISITIGEDVVKLRDENGRPVWRGKGRL